MKKADRNALIALPAIILVGIGIAFSGSDNGVVVWRMPLFALTAGLAFLIQWLAFIPAYWRQTEKFFDITGSLTYISVTVIAVLLSPKIDGRSLLLLALVVIWAGRLGIFLFRRVHKAGKDGRFDDIKPSFPPFLVDLDIAGIVGHLHIGRQRSGHHRHYPPGIRLVGPDRLPRLAVWIHV